MRLLDDDPDLPPPINIIPAIDIILSILAFFIISSLDLIRNEGFPVNLPGANTAEIQEQPQLTVTIDRQGQIALDDQIVDFNNLDSEVRDVVPANSTAFIILRADTAVPYGRVVAVMDRLNRIEGVKLAIATSVEP
ncbi:MAG: biopolymer transporter ExbD [Cyanobacteria bacterium J055]|nr:MAG: biopolymer transporter ExbD [Cyanobacteria bacterium J055]